MATSFYFEGARGEYSSSDLVSISSNNEFIFDPTLRTLTSTWFEVDAYSPLVSSPPSTSVLALLSVRESFSLPGNDSVSVEVDGDPTNPVYVYGNSSFTYTPVSSVPLPAGGVLLLSALGGVAALKRRKKRAA